jgi:hypothetical protein
LALPALIAADQAVAPAAIGRLRESRRSPRLAAVGVVTQGGGMAAAPLIDRAARSG